MTPGGDIMLLYFSSRQTDPYWNYDQAFITALGLIFPVITRLRGLIRVLAL